MAADPRSEGLRLIVCDSNPDTDAYRTLEDQYPTKVQSIDSPIDFSKPHTWEANTTLFLSGTLHHVPSAARSEVFAALVRSAERVMVFEPLRKTVLSVLFVFGSIVPAIVLPARLIHRPGRFRRLVWCWLLPVAPVMFLWDGFVSCLRMWTKDEWQLVLNGLASTDRTATVTESLFCQQVVI
jgi:hypothetical protein